MCTFVSIDFETANADLASICQIGVARFADGAVADCWSTLVDPEDDFSGFNVAIHGIEPEMVVGQPTFPQIADHLRTLLTINSTTICHTPFDRVALGCATEKYALAPILTRWMDSARIARRAWKECAWTGYGLAKICKRIGYEFKHHDALEDAKAAGFVVLAAIRETGLALDGWGMRVGQPIDPTMTPLRHLDGNPDGDLFGEVVVFTGELIIPRRDAAAMAAQLGCEVCQSVTRKTSLLVVGDQDVRRLAGHNKSAKHRKAEELIAEGANIRILRESDFNRLVASDCAN